MVNSIPKIIWFLWLQGEDAMPFVVKNCYRSWNDQNPDYKVNLVTSENLEDLVELDDVFKDNPILTKQSFSDVVRVYLLEKHGGVWVDATCFCNKPLSSWLEEGMTTDFYAFQNPGVDRLISSWFLASQTKGKSIVAYKGLVLDYWQKNNFKRQIPQPSGNGKDLDKLGQTTALSWLIMFRFNKVVRLKKVSPYFWFHYLFTVLLRTNYSIKVNWFKQNALSSDLPHFLTFNGLVSALTPEIKEHIDEKKSPLYKLDWRIEEKELLKNSILTYLFNKENHA